MYVYVCVYICIFFKLWDMSKKKKTLLISIKKEVNRNYL